MDAPRRATAESARKKNQKNLGLGHLVRRGSAQMLAFTMSLCPPLHYPGRSILRSACVISSWDHFTCDCHCGISMQHKKDRCANVEFYHELIFFPLLVPRVQGSYPRRCLSCFFFFLRTLAGSRALIETKRSQLMPLEGRGRSRQSRRVSSKSFHLRSQQR